MSNKEAYKNGVNTQFSSENQPANAGRRKNMFTALKDKYELSANDVSSIIEYLCSLTQEQLHDQILNNPEKTVLEIAFAKAILEATKKGDLSQIEKLLDRKVGKVPSKIEADINANIETANKFKIVEPNN
jgi:hypothetical protein